MKQIMLKATLVVMSPSLFSFCGIYVSKYDSPLKNKTSQVILVRDGEKTMVTMYNDFKGDTKDFAMVVPVPVVLQKADIRVVDQAIFQKLNDYSAPRLVEYYDQNPCNLYETYKDEMLYSKLAMSESVMATKSITKRKYGVTIEAQYLIGEYDILILSALESGGLKAWLLKNGYKIPEAAEEVLEPYIKSNLKFFVAKVNKEHNTMAGNFLRPIQISFSSPKFILPIRLGMANSDGDQDLLVYCFTKKGRVECVNYRNVDMPTGNNIPLFVKDDFSRFYEKSFTNKWRREGKNIGILEYAWDVSPITNVKCDPCIGPPPVDQDFVQAGIWWLGQPGSQSAFFTRMHFRYNRSSFPQDLVFQVTPNKNNFQARYVITHPATGSFNCDEGRKYLQDLKKRRKSELRELVSLTGSTLSDYLEDSGIGFNDEPVTDETRYAALAASVKREMDAEDNGSMGMAVLGVLMVSAAGVMRWKGLI
jgi:hypothetical protein